MNDLRDKVDQAIAGPVLHNFDGWRLDRPVVWDHVDERTRSLLRTITDAAIATVMEAAGWQDIMAAQAIIDAADIEVEGDGFQWSRELAAEQCKAHRIAAEKAVLGRFDEDWLADTIQDSFEMDWTARDGARAIIRSIGLKT